MFPVLGRVVVKGQKRLAILDQLGNGLVVFDSVGFDKEIESRASLGLGFGLPDAPCVSVVVRPSSFPLFFGWAG